MTTPPSVRNVFLLGTAQTLAWASTYYLPAVLAAAMAKDTGVDTPTVFAAFTMALLVSAAVGPWAGRAIDRRGGRPVLAGTSLVFATALVLLARAEDGFGLFLAWAVMGIGMGSGLYEAGFATLVRLHGDQARSSITGITLLAGFASTVGWPLSAWMESQWGWRGACLGWAAMHLLLGLPLNLLLPKAQPLGASAGAEPATPPADTGVASTDRAAATIAASRADDGPPGGHPAAADAQGTPTPDRGLRTVLLLSFVFSGSLFVSTALASHLPQLLMASGVSLAAAVALGGLIGPAQVAARVLEFGVLQKLHPLLSGRIASALHPLGVAVLLAFGAPGAAAFCLLHGAGNGILTIAKGTMTLAIFGAQGYGQRQGLLLVPARIAQALAPWLFGLALARWGLGSLYLSAAVGVAMVGALMMLRATPADADPDAR
ncbi:MAG: MFS transporter [Ramlibacter sp.]|uniref:MFS transporter n=1 Tax=Ramlibacter sp. TaxID=1917967 RepID=UPI002624C3CC|nr:MFS transporter [Ramlibacter sp.]MDH4376650.1 MFS transporter [Ramlibacter sp.]